MSGLRKGRRLADKDDNVGGIEDLDTRREDLSAQQEKIVSQTPRRPRKGKRGEQKIPRRFRKGIHGIVSDLDISKSQTDEEILRFRLAEVDEQGNIVRENSVEMQANEITGRVIREGDAVVVIGRRNRQGYVEPRAIYVLATRSKIFAKKRGVIGRTMVTLVSLPVGIIGLASWIGLLIGTFLLIAGESEGGGIVLLSAGGLLVHFLFQNIFKKYLM